MKNLTRLILASLSTLLLAAGLARAAERLDPVSSHCTPLTSPLLPEDPCMACTSCDDAAE